LIIVISLASTFSFSHSSVIVTGGGRRLSSSLIWTSTAFSRHDPGQVQINTVAPARAPKKRTSNPFPIDNPRRVGLGWGGWSVLDDLGFRRCLTFEELTNIYFARQRINERLHVRIGAGIGRPNMGAVVNVVSASSFLTG